MSEIIEHEGVKYRKDGRKAEVGDKIIVVYSDDFMERYKDGDIFTVSQVHYGYTNEPIYDSECGWDFYDWEVEVLVEAEEDAMRQTIDEIPSTRGEVQTYEPNFDWGADDPEWEEMETVGREIIEDHKRDSVEHPSHYTQGGVEVIEIIAQTVSGYDDGFTAHCVGTATKYLNRAPFKHETPLEDLRKAAKYLEFAIEHEEKKRK